MSDSVASNEPTVPDRRPKRPAPRGLASYARKRAVTACQVCRARRTKCDNLKPSCSFCLKTGATCIQSPVDFSSFDPASLKILERLDDVEALLRAMPAKTAEPPPNPEATLCPREDGLNSLSSCDILPQTVEGVLAWPVFRGLTPALVSGSPSTSSTSAASLRTLAASYPVSAIALLLQNRQQINSLVDNFFNFVHVKNPILSEEDTRLLVSTITIEGISWSASSCLFLLICALGSIATPFGPSDPVMLGTEAYTHGKAFFEAAEKRLGALIASGGLVGAQCFFLSGVYKMCVFRPREAWRFFLQALAICQDFLPITPGLSFPEHRGDGQGRTLHEAVFWSAWKSEMELRGELCLPDFAAGDRDTKTYPSFFPTPPPPSPRASNNTSMGASTPEATRESAAWFFYLTEISLRRIVLDVSREMLALCKHVSPRVAMRHLADAVPAWEGQLQDWVRSLPAALSFDAPAEEDDVCRFVLRGHFINLLETIYWPFTTFYLRGAGTEAESRLVELAQKGLETHARRISVNRPGFRHRHHGTFPMIRSCTRSALILVAFALQGTSLFSMPANWHRDVQAVLDLMRYWEGEYVELAEQRTVLELAFSSLAT